MMGRICWRNCATSRRVAGSISDGVIVIVHRHNPYGRIMALGLTQYDMSTVADGKLLSTFRSIVVPSSSG